jgi:hypothetical protein
MLKTLYLLCYFKSYMRRFKFIFCLGLASFATLTSQTVNKTLNVLFLGNSYTYFNNLPALVDSLALSNGDNLNYDQNTPGGHTFNNHFNNATSIAKIKSQNWEYVILQAQSQEPSFSPSQVNSQTFPFAVKLDSVIKGNHLCSQTVFYETWGRKFGDQGNCAAYPPVCTYTGMQDRLRSSYKAFADSAKGVMAPVGEAFRKSIALNPNLNLYIADNSHPSLEGSYLAACVFYEVLFKKSCLNNTYYSQLSSNTAGFLQQVAHTTVTDSLQVWNLGRFEPYAPFTYSVSAGNTVQFQSVSTGSNHVHTWYFGDGTTSAQISPSHTYSMAQVYTVRHVVSNGCKKDSVVQVVNVLASQLSEKASQRELFFVYPNPAKEQLNIHLSGGHEDAQLSIYNSNGKLVYQEMYAPTLALNRFSSGLYFMALRSRGEVYYARFTVE